MTTIAVEDIDACLADAERQLASARDWAVSLEQENAELQQQIAGALAAARNLTCICDPMDLPDICPACSVIAHLELPGMGHYFEAPF
jgi:hypothetical protein